MRRLAALAVVTLLLLSACGDDSGGEPDPTSTASTAAPTAAETPPAGETSPTPGAQVPNVAPSSDIVMPPGFAAYPIATGFLRATAVAPADDGSIFVSERGGTVYRLVDADGDGVFEQTSEFASGFETITGLLVAFDGTLYVSSTGRITTVRDTDGDGVGDASEGIITGLPNGRHQNNGLVIGPDNKLYITNGSTCDDCLEADERSATILQSNLDGSELRVYARGLRNPYDITFDNGGRLWATDNGSDAPCETDDELNLIVDGGDYGWPYGNDGCDETTDGTPPYASLGLHTASTGITTFRAGSFPEGYNGSLFVTVWGSLFADPEPYDRQLLHVPINPLSMPDERIPESVDIEVFASGFEHPIDVETGGGSLLVLDYGSDDPEARSGTLYEIIYTGQ
jgi:glucose/arabinose dehydrogenase